MRRKALGAASAAATLAVAAAAYGAHPATFDHPVPTFAQPAPLSSAVNAGGTNAEWELVTTIPTGNPHSDLDFFTRGGETFLSAGTLANGPNAGGQTIVQLTQDGAVDPTYVTGHPSASCLSGSTSVTGLQHDVEAAPKGTALPQQSNPFVVTRDTELLVDATDAGGRCHDQGNFGFGQLGTVPNGGLEYIDVTDPANPKEIALTTHIGNAHTVNVDPKRPHIAFDVTQDGVTVGEDGKRANETSGNALDGFEVIDMSSCMNFPPGTTIETKRQRCRPEVYRYRYPEARMAASHTYPDALQSCHELEIYPDDRIACASITSTILFDVSGAFDDRGTPNDYSDDRPRGTPLPCRVRESSSASEPFRTAAPIVDCVSTDEDLSTAELNVSGWLKLGAPSLEGVRWLGTVPHMGFQSTDQIVNVPYDATEDIVAAHESELSNSGRFVFTSDERGGGVLPAGATCTPGADYARGNGGIHAFPVSKFSTATPLSAEASHALWAKDSEGDRAVYRTPIRTQPQGAFCTAHVFQQIPGQNRIFMGWYSQGTDVVDYTENADGTIDFKQAAYFTPENANTWTSHVFKVQANQDGTFTYWGATADGILPGTGRGAIDIYKVTLPPPPKPLGGTPAGTPTFPVSDVRGVENERSAPCARTAAFQDVRARPRGRGLEFSFPGRRRGGVRVDLMTFDYRRRLRFPSRTRTFRWNGRARGLRNGYYRARFRARALNGRVEQRQVALRRVRGRWRVLPGFERRDSCGFLRIFALSSPAFRRTLRVAFQLSSSARVDVEIRRGSRVVRRYRSLRYRGGTRRLTVRGLRRGTYRVRLVARRTGRTTTATLRARRF
jgi:hypothetical protein